jgi:hypothetical protein
VIGVPRKEVQLVFAKPEPRMIEPTGMGAIQTATIAKLDEVLSWFKDYRVDSIELSIEASAKSGDITSLFVSAEGKGGMKVTLKPKQH